MPKGRNMRPFLFHVPVRDILTIEVMTMESMINKQRTFFNEGHTKPRAFRQERLEALERMITDNQEEIEAALKEDLNKSAFEAYATEIGITLHSLRRAKRKLKRWMKERRVRTPLHHGFTKSRIRPEPLGVVLIVGPYNYPFHLSIEPLIGALAAGNTVVLKPSEFPKAMEKLLKRLIQETFDERHVHIVTGGKETMQRLLEQTYDHIFFTGSPRVGQIVYEAAAKRLTPVTLELGGKSPAIVDSTARLEIAARRIAFGKGLNAGQTCIAPDYVYVESSIREEFIKRLKDTFNAFYGSRSETFGRIINDRHYERITSLIDEKKVVYGNHRNPKARYLSPTIVDGVDFDDAIMQEEIFGPVLPVLSFKSLDEAIGKLQQLPRPLALYHFSESKRHTERVFNSLSFGTGAINDTVMQVANPHLPFGGVGRSGIGVYHGRHSFETFSHMKPYIKKSTRIDPPIVYPPYTGKKERLVRRILK